MGELRIPVILAAVDRITVTDDTTVIGIDCATQRKKVGLARGHVSAGAVVVEEVRLGSEVASMVELIAGWIRGRTLLAIDAPLGWPMPLGKALGVHRAGETVAGVPNEMFRRETDRVVHRTIGKMPLDVGADRIARTAHAALCLLGEVRTRMGLPVPLVWTPTFVGVGAIEVYPAATLASRAWQHSGYKSDPQTSPAARRALIERLRGEASFQVDVDRLEACDDLLDAAICLVAGADFLRGRCVEPSAAARATADVEGWIWFRTKGPT